MPRNDGTGPYGQGPRTGRGRGGCAAPVEAGWARGEGRRRRQRCGALQGGQGRGLGRGPGRGFGRGFGADAPERPLVEALIDALRGAGRSPRGSGDGS